MKVKRRILGAGTALKHLPSEEELERIDREWKLAIEERVFDEHIEIASWGVKLLGE